MLFVGDKEHDMASNPVLKFLRRRMPLTDDLHGQSFIVKQPDPRTGRIRRFATPLLLALVMIEIADLVTEMTVVKHPFRQGIKAQAGIEF